MWFGLRKLRLKGWWVCWVLEGYVQGVLIYMKKTSLWGARWGLVAVQFYEGLKIPLMFFVFIFC